MTSKIGCKECKKAQAKTPDIRMAFQPILNTQDETIFA